MKRKIRLSEKYLRGLIREEIRKVCDANRTKAYMRDVLRPFVQEGLIMSFAPLRVKRIAERKFNLSNIGCKISLMPRKDYNLFPTPKGAKTTSEMNGWFDFDYVFNFGIGDLSYEYLQSIIEFMDRMGWVLANIQVYFGQEIRSFGKLTPSLFEQMRRNLSILAFQAKYDQEITNEELPKYCYHICPLRVLKKIKTVGLTPRAEYRSANHPSRVYLFLKLPYDWKDISNRFKQKKDEPYCLLRIDMDKVSKQMTFMFDSNMITEWPSIYTYEPIPPSAISVMDVDMDKMHS